MLPPEPSPDERTDAVLRLARALSDRDDDVSIAFVEGGQRRMAVRELLGPWVGDPADAPDAVREAVFDATGWPEDERDHDRLTRREAARTAHARGTLRLTLSHATVAQDGEALQQRGFSLMYYI